MADEFSDTDGSSEEPVAGHRGTGRVKWFNNTKGFGFIVADDSDDGSDLFAHYSAIEMNGYRTLKAGQQVSFTTADGPKGLHAMAIRAVDMGAPQATDQASNDDLTGEHDRDHQGIDVELPSSEYDAPDVHDDDPSLADDDDNQLSGGNAAQR